MKILSRWSLITILTIICALIVSLSLKAKNNMNLIQKKAIIIIAHGAPSPIWCAKVNALESQVNDKLDLAMPNNKYLVKVAFMEFSKPTIANIFSDFEKQGITDVLAVPLFFAPSGHSSEDIPNILGLAYNPKTIKALKEEGTELVSTRIKIQLAPTMNYGDVVSDIIFNRVKNVINENQKENLLLIAHGSVNYYYFWKEMLTRAGEKLKNNTSIDNFDFAFVEMGQEFKKNAIPKIEELKKNGHKVILQGVYLSSGANLILNISGCAYLLKDNSLVVTKDGLLPDNRVSSWIVDRITDWK